MQSSHKHLEQSSGWLENRKSDQLQHLHGLCGESLLAAQEFQEVKPMMLEQML